MMGVDAQRVNLKSLKSIPCCDSDWVHVLARRRQYMVMASDPRYPART